MYIFSSDETMIESFHKNDNFMRALAFLDKYYNVDGWRIQSNMLQVHYKGNLPISAMKPIDWDPRSDYFSGWHGLGYAYDKLYYTSNQFIGHILTTLKIPHDEQDIKEKFLRYEYYQGKGGDIVDLEEKAEKKGRDMAQVLIDVFGPPSSSAAFRSLFNLGTFFAKCEGFQNEERNAYAMSFGQKMIDHNRVPENGSNILPPASL